MTTSKKAHFHATVALVVGSFAAGFVLSLLLPDVFEVWNARATDRLFVFRSSLGTFRPSYDPTVVFVDLNDSSLNKMKTAYVHRLHISKVVENLASMGVAAQVFDFVFAAPVGEVDDRPLIEAAKKAKNVYFGVAFELANGGRPFQQVGQGSEGSNDLDPTKWHVPAEGNTERIYHAGKAMPTFSELALNARGLGFLSVKFDMDGTLRRVPLLVRFRGAFYPALALRVVCDFLRVSPDRLLLKPGKHIILRDAKRPGEREAHDIAIPIDIHGNMIVNYIGPWEAMDHYHFADILQASDRSHELRKWKTELEGKIVVISDVSTGSTDIGPVPTDSNFPLSGVHAHTIHTILTESFIREPNAFQMLLIELALLSVVLLFSLILSPLWFSGGTFSLSAFYLGMATFSFFQGNLLLPIIRPLVMTMLAFISITLYRYIHAQKERTYVREVFGRYLSNEVVEELLSSQKGPSMSGEMREMTFLVADIRGFTPFSSKLSPQEVIPILNRYFESMTDIVISYRGTIDELRGDGLLVFFGAPLKKTDDPERAIACSLEMQNKMMQLNEEHRCKNLPELRMGVAVHTGEAVVGNIGSMKRAKYGAVGNAINLTFRIESQSVGGQVLVSEETHRRSGAEIFVRGVVEPQLKGIENPVKLYDVVGIGGKYQVYLHGAQSPE